MKRLIFVLCLLSCLSACKKEHVEPIPTNDATVNRLPKKVMIKKGDSYTIQKYKYNAQGLVTTISIYNSLTPNNQDSILYSYDSNNRISIIRVFSDNYVSGQVYDYRVAKLNTFYDFDTVFYYNYTTSGDVDYIIKTNLSKSFKDSIKIYPGSAWSYLGKGEGTLGASHDYRDSKIEYFFNTENGVYPDRGSWNTPNPVFGDPAANTTVCLNKNIEFQNEVAYTIVPIGQAGYYNMFPRTEPYKYATHAEYLLGPIFKFSQYNAAYTFDVHGRLMVIDAQALSVVYNNSDPDMPQALPAVMDFTSTIYY